MTEESNNTNEHEASNYAWIEKGALYPLPSPVAEPSNIKLDTPTKAALIRGFIVGLIVLLVMHLVFD